MEILDLSLTYYWYDMIASGEKKEEYRDIKKQFYISRLIKNKKMSDTNEFRHYDAVRFHRGQGGKTTMLVECKGVYIGYGKQEWGALPNVIYFVIKLGNFLEKNGCKN